LGFDRAVLADRYPELDLRPPIGVERDAAPRRRPSPGTPEPASSLRGDNRSASKIPGLRPLPALCLLVPSTTLTPCAGASAVRAPANPAGRMIKVRQ